MDSITAMFDDILGPVSGKVPPAEVSTIYVSEGYAATIEALSDMFLTPMGSALTQTLVGVGLGAVGIALDDIPVRLRSELMEISSHEIFRLVDILPKRQAEVKGNVGDLVEGLKAGDVEKLKASFLKDFDTLKRELGIENVKMVGEEVSEDIAAGYDYEEEPIVAEDTGASYDESEELGEEEVLAA